MTRIISLILICLLLGGCSTEGIRDINNCDKCLEDAMNSWNNFQRTSRTNIAIACYLKEILKELKDDKED